MPSRKYPTKAEAFAAMEQIGKLDYFGLAGNNHEYAVCNLTLPSGRKYGINIYEDGLVKIRE